MMNQVSTGEFATISQRSVASYLKTLVDFEPVGNADQVQAQRDLHAFFVQLYANLYAQPERFGLPLQPDDSIGENEPNPKDKKQLVKRLLDKPRRIIESGLDFLRLAGFQGSLESQALVIEQYPALFKESGINKKFLPGLEETGLSISLAGERAVFSSERFPKMLPALQLLARGCAAYSDERMCKFQFAACDFRALNGCEPQAQDLYRFFEGFEHTRLVELHTYFTSRNYKALVEVYAPWMWTVKYQGNRKIKASPLFEVMYDDRHARRLRMQIKCASTARLIPWLPGQPQLLQEDFAHRVNRCVDDGWCRNQKTLGPTPFEYQGESITICWYVNPDIRRIDENTVELIRQYEQMHAGLPVDN